MSLRVRPAVPADFDPLLELRAALWPDEDRDDLASFLTAALAGRPESTLPLANFVAEENEFGLLGFIEVGLRSHANGCDSRRAVGFVEGWFVAEKARKRGVGRALIRAAEEWSRAQGCTELASDTWLDAQLSEQAHLGVGFEVADRCIDFRKSIAPDTNPDLDGRVHHQIMKSFVDRGFASTTGELAATLKIDRLRIEASLRRLHEGHGVVLHPGSTEVWIAHPFSSSPSGVFVRDGERGWWAPCLWCGMGIATLAAPGATLTARYGGEDDSVRIDLRDPTSPIVVHFATPPREAWNNVLHWCATVQPFQRAEDVDAWCARHRLPRGVIVPIEQVQRLGRAWYGRHLDEDWKKWTIAEAQAIFDSVGLTGDFWRLPTSPGNF